MPLGTLMMSRPGQALASWIAARSVQTPLAVAQAPLPGLASTSSTVLLTVKVSAAAGAALAAAAASAPARASIAAGSRGGGLPGGPAGCFGHVEAGFWHHEEEEDEKALVVRSIGC